VLILKRLEPSAVCEAYPACDEGDLQVAEASACEAGTACYERSICGTAIWCSGTTSCRAVPRCDDGDTQVEKASVCLQDDARCYPREACGARIWCTGPVR
jgi:hypothetical protein